MGFSAGRALCHLRAAGVDRHKSAIQCNCDPVISERFGKGTPRHGLLDEDIGPESSRWRSRLHPRNVAEKDEVDQVPEKDPVGGFGLPEQP
jgi:hypothetical protein